MAQPPGANPEERKYPYADIQEGKTLSEADLQALLEHYKAELGYDPFDPNVQLTDTQREKLNERLREATKDLPPPCWYPTGTEDDVVIKDFFGIYRWTPPAQSPPPDQQES